MKKLAAMIVGVALCTPTVGVAQQYNTDISDATVITTEYDSLEACEAALAQARRDLRDQYQYTGRDRGQSNKAFNQRYQCSYDDEADAYIVSDDMSDSDEE